MLFSSLTFIFLFMPILLASYFIIKNRTYRNIILLVFSLLFYAWGEPIYVFIMIFSIFNDYVHSIYIEKAHNKGNNKLAKILLISSICINLGFLFSFKYLGFVVENINYLPFVKMPIPNQTLPIGLSFYTFQTMSYTIDVYRKKVSAQKNIITLGTYVALFPQLVAGPIVRYIDIEDELENREESITLFASGLRRFIIGLGKKVIIANNVAIIAVFVFDTLPVDSYTFIIVWIGLIAFTLQIYFDFSGYSDMAIGLGQIFGFNFLENFNYPYVSKSITEFWKRWHISLSTWFREYVYIPLGGNRVSKLKWVRNIFIVWLLTGFWHGASWNYILWGLYFAVILLVEKKFLSKNILKINILNSIYTIFLFTIGWAIFRNEDFDKLISFMGSLFNVFNFGNLQILKDEMLLFYLLFIPIGIVGSMPVYRKLQHQIQSIQDSTYRTAALIMNDTYIILVGAISVMYLVSQSFNPFIYFNF